MENNDLELAITNYLDTRDINLLKPFVGTLKKDEKEPFGEPELGRAINVADFVTVNSLVDKMTTFSSDSPNTSRLLNIVNKIDKATNGRGANNFIKIMKYIMSGKAPSKVPSGYTKAIDNNDWTFLVYGCRAH